MRFLGFGRATLQGFWGEGGQKATAAHTQTQVCASGRTYAIDFGKAWIKSPSMTAGQCPVVVGELRVLPGTRRNHNDG